MTSVDRIAIRMKVSPLGRVSSAKGAEYKSQGQARSVSPLVYAVRAIRPDGPKYVQYYAPSGLGEFDSCTRGDALRACPWLLYSAPLALDVRIRPSFESKRIFVG